jgi:hypothetical protein
MVHADSHDYPLAPSAEPNMQEVLSHIEEQRKRYRDHVFFTRLLTNELLPGDRRPAWAPSVILFIMGYSDLNKYVFRKGEGDADLEPLQVLLNFSPNARRR